MEPGGSDPVASLLLAGAVAGLFGAPGRKGRPWGALLGALAAVGTSAVLGAEPGRMALAGALGLGVAWLAPLQGPRREAGTWEAGSRGGAASEAWSPPRGARAERLVDPADRLRLESAVLAAEAESAGEISVVVVDACGDYASVAWRAGVWLAALAFLGGLVLAPGLPLWGLFGLQAGALAAGHAACRRVVVRRHLVAEGIREAQVLRCARRVFAERGLERNPARAGIVVLVAILEGRVAVLGDEGLDRAVAPETWQAVAALAAGGLREGRAIEGLLAAVERCGELLARHAPAAAARALEELPEPVVVSSGPARL